VVGRGRPGLPEGAQVGVAQPVGVGEDVDLDDPVGADGETQDRGDRRAGRRLVVDRQAGPSGFLSIETCVETSISAEAKAAYDSPSASSN